METYVYRFLNADSEVIYVGRTTNILQRMYTHFNEGHLPTECYNEVVEIEYIEFGTINDMKIAEIYFISKYLPKYNTLDSSPCNLVIGSLENIWLKYSDYLATNYDIVSAIKNKDFATLRNHYTNNGAVLNVDVKSRREAGALISNLDVYKLFGLQMGVTQDCVLSGKLNSTSIFMLPNGAYIYKTFGNKEITLNNVQLFSELTNLNIFEAQNILQELLGINIVYPSDVIELENKLLSFAEEFKSIDVNSYPYLFKTFDKFSHEVYCILKTISKYKYEYISDESENVSFMFLNHFDSYAMADIVYGSSIRNKKIAKLCNLLTYVQVFNKLDDDDLPYNLKEILTESKDRKNNKYRKNVYTINFDLLSFDNIEIICKDLWGMGYTFKTFSQDFLTLNVDINKGNEIFIQNKNKELPKKLENFIDTLESLLNFETVYIYEMDIKAELVANGFSKSYIKDNYNKVFNMILTKLNLKKIRLTNELKDMYGIANNNPKYRPNIIVKA